MYFEKCVLNVVDTKVSQKNYMIRIYQNVLRTTVFKTRTLVFFAGILIQYFQRYIVNFTDKCRKSIGIKFNWD